MGQQDRNAAAVEALGERSRNVAAAAMQDAPDFEQAELSISMALLLVQGVRAALQKRDWQVAIAHHEEEQRRSSSQSAPDTTEYPGEFAPVSGNK